MSKQLQLVEILYEYVGNMASLHDVAKVAKLPVESIRDLCVELDEQYHNLIGDEEPTDEQVEQLNNLVIDYAVSILSLKK